MDSVYGFIGEYALFGLLAIKSYQLITKHVIPALKQMQRDAGSHWIRLHEKHSILISKKKDIATLFLHQEKQLSLLSTRISDWQIHSESRRRHTSLLRSDRAREALDREHIQYETFLFEDACAREIGILVRELRTELSQPTSADLRATYLKQTLTALTLPPRDSQITQKVEPHV